MPRDIEFFFDIGSPYSYLAATQMADVAERTGAKVHWKPFLLGGVFKAVGNEPPAALEKKRAWLFRDLELWADHYGVPFRMKSHFPINSLLPQRALVAAGQVDESRVPAFALELYEDYWTRDVDVSQPEALADCAERAGYSAEELLEMSGEAHVKEALRQLSDEAVRRGAFGAPTFFVGDEMFWGNDRLMFVEKAAKED